MNFKARNIFILLVIVTTIVSIFFAALMTEIGQMLNWPREWVVTYYAHRWFFLGMNIALLVALWCMHVRYRFCRPFWMYLASFGVAICIVAANFLLPTFFPSYQRGAQYVNLEAANKILKDKNILYAVEINGKVLGFPRKHLEIPHIAGAKVDGKAIVMTFCALSNLPVVYPQNIGYGESELRILIQTHNNLLMVDKKSGELIQQITGKLEFSGGQLKPIPNAMMTWAVFKKKYPNAKVFIYPFNRPLDTVLRSLFEGGLEKQFSEKHGPMFPTLDLKDQRLPNKEQVWGLIVKDKQAAFTKSFLKKAPRYVFSMGGQKLMITYDKRTNIVKAFKLGLQNSHKKPEEIALYNGVFWMIWVHWFPKTKVFS